MSFQILHRNFSGFFPFNIPQKQAIPVLGTNDSYIGPVPISQATQWWWKVKSWQIAVNMTVNDNSYVDNHGVTFDHLATSAASSTSVNSGSSTLVSPDGIPPINNLGPTIIPPRRTVAPVFGGAYRGSTQALVFTPSTAYGTCSVSFRLFDSSVPVIRCVDGNYYVFLLTNGDGITPVNPSPTPTLFQFYQDIGFSSGFVTPSEVASPSNPSGSQIQTQGSIDGVSFPVILQVFPDNSPFNTGLPLTGSCSVVVTRTDW